MTANSKLNPVYQRLTNEFAKVVQHITKRELASLPRLLPVCRALDTLPFAKKNLLIADLINYDWLLHEPSLQQFHSQSSDGFFLSLSYLQLWSSAHSEYTFFV